MTARPNQPAGHQMGRIISHLITNTVRDTRAAVAPAEAEMKRRSLEGMMDDWEVNLGDRLGQVLSDLDFGEGAPAIIELMKEVAGQPTNQIDLLIQIILLIPFAITGAGTAAGIVYRNFFNTLNEKFPSQPISPGTVADGVARGLIDHGSASQEALFSGVRGEAFNWLVDLAGTTPGVGELLTMAARGLIGVGHLEVGLHQLGIRPEWVAPIVALAHAPLSPAAAVEAAVKGVVSQGQGAAIYERGGGLVGDFATAFAAAGNAIGIEAAGRLRTHNLISEGDLQAAIRYSHINPRFEGMAGMLRFHWLSAFQIHNLVTSGTIDSATAKRWLIEDGYSAEQAEGLSHHSQKPSTKKAKDASESLIIDTYEAGFSTKDQAVAHLVVIGYTPEAAGILIDSFDARKILASMQSAVTKIREAFLARRITKQVASSDLDTVGVHPNLRDHYLADWDVERTTVFKVLTTAQVGHLAHVAIITRDDAKRRWIAAGYSAEDAELLALTYVEKKP